MPFVELTTDQARAADALRRRWPGALVVSHPREWGVILEARVGDRVADLVALTADGRIEHDADLRHAA